MTQKKSTNWKLKTFLSSPTTTSNVFVVVVMFAFIALAYTTLNQKLNKVSLNGTFHTLLGSVTQGGLSQFKSDKNELKKEVQKVLNQPKNEEEESFAYGIALYLFPEILPDSNFEKQTALTLWAPLEEEIEKKPRTAEARMLFEELKTNIWNYENPKVESVGLSSQAEQTLKIYYELSSP